MEHSLHSAWALLENSKNIRSGYRQHFSGDWKWSESTRSGLVTALFRTRQQARDFREERFGYLRDRPDLKAEPHGWRMPRVVKVKIIVQEVL